MLALPNTTSPAVAISDSEFVCRSRFRDAAANSPTSISLNGQDFNLHRGLCDVQPGAANRMWRDPGAVLLEDEAANVVPARVQYPTLEGNLLWNGCPFVFYRHPTTLGLEPAGGPTRGDIPVKVFGRGFNVFAEDVRCKFGSETDVWLYANDRVAGAGDFGRFDEVRCSAPPHLTVTIQGQEIACTFDCQRFPDDPSRCRPAECSFNVTRRMLGFRLAVAEVIGTRDVRGDIDVLPSDITIETFRQPRSPETPMRRPSLDVLICMHCLTANVTHKSVSEAVQVISAIRTGRFLAQLHRYGLTSITMAEVNGDFVPLMIALNGQDYTFRTNPVFSYYLDPQMAGVTPGGGPLIRYATADAAHKTPTLVEVSGTGFSNYDESPQCNPPPVPVLSGQVSSLPSY